MLTSFVYSSAVLQERSDTPQFFTKYLADVWNRAQVLLKREACKYIYEVNDIAM